VLGRTTATPKTTRFRFSGRRTDRRKAAGPALSGNAGHVGIVVKLPPHFHALVADVPGISAQSRIRSFAPIPSVAAEAKSGSSSACSWSAETVSRMKPDGTRYCAAANAFD